MPGIMTVARGVRPAGPFARHAVEAIGVFRKRAGVTTKALYEAAGMSPVTFFARNDGRGSFSLNEIEAFARVIGVTPVDIVVMAASLGDLAPARAERGVR